MRFKCCSTVAASATCRDFLRQNGLHCLTVGLRSGYSVAGSPWICGASWPTSTKIRRFPMPMFRRDEVYSAINGERDYQDACQGNSAREDVDDNRNLGDLILLTEIYLDKAKAA